jgi:WD40 repeat protein
LREVLVLRGPSDAITTVVFRPDGQVLASVEGNLAVWLWRMPDGAALRTIKPEGAGKFSFSPVIVAGVTFSPDGQTMAFGGSSLWRVVNDSLLRTNVNMGVHNLTFSPDGQLLAYGSKNSDVMLRRASDGAVVRALEGHSEPVGCVAFSPDGQLLASGDWDCELRLWRVADGALLAKFDSPHKDNVNSVAFSPDGQLLAYTSFQHVLLRRVADGTIVRTLEPKGAGSFGWRATSANFSPDGQMLSVIADKTAQVWRVADGALLGTLKGHTKGVNSLKFSPDGHMMASGSSDKTVRLWAVPH